jgi:MraZ protein
LYLRKDVYQDCIVVYPAPVWEEELSELRARLNKWNPEEQELYRQFMLEAEAVEMDINGRILIPKRLLLKTGIEKALRFLGVDNTMEIWAKEALEQPRLDPELFKSRLQELMTKTPE